MPLPHNFHAFVGAALLGVVSAAGMFLVEHYRQDKQRHAMAKDLARLDEELSQVRRELNQILVKQKEKSGGKSKKSKGEGRAHSVMSSSSTTTLDGYISANELESSDMEFYDVSDEEDSENENGEVWDTIFRDYDDRLDEGSLADMQKVLRELEDLASKHPQNAELLWRIGKAHHRVYERLDLDDTTGRKDHIIKGIEVCTSALQLNNNSGSAHKWMAVLLGIESDFLPLKEKIACTHKFKTHVEAALKHYPKDESLHHMLGRLSYELAGLKWYERKVAAALFGEPPTATFEEALEHFMEAEELSKKEWKTNKLFVAKSKIALSDFKGALSWLDQAEKIEDSSCDPKDCQDLKNLLEQYKGYR